MSLHAFKRSDYRDRVDGKYIKDITGFQALKLLMTIILLNPSF